MFSKISGSPTPHRSDEHNGANRKRAATDGSHSYVDISAADEVFPFDDLAELVQVRIFRMLDIPDAVNARVVTSAMRILATDKKVWGLNASLIGFPMACIPTSASTRMKEFYRGLRKKGAKLEKHPWNITGILRKDAPTLGEIRSLADHLGETLDQSDYELVKNFVKELLMVAAEIEDQPADITEILEAKVPTIAQINDLQAWLKARAELRLWKELATGFYLPCPNFHEARQAGSVAMIELAGGFRNWCEINKATLGEECHSFNLSNFKLLVIPEEIGYLTGAGRLLLENNHLSELPTSMRKLSYLDALDLTNNRFTTVPEVISANRSLEVLKLSANQLTSIPEWFKHLNNLRTLYISNNKISSLPSFLFRNNSLRDMSVDGNPIFELPNDFLYYIKEGSTTFTSTPELLPWWNSVAERINCPIRPHFANNPENSVTYFLEMLEFTIRTIYRYRAPKEVCNLVATFDVDAIIKLVQFLKNNRASINQSWPGGIPEYLIPTFNDCDQIASDKDPG